MRVQEGFGATVGEPVDASITIGDVTLSRTTRGWSVQTIGAVDLAQLDTAVQLAKQVPVATTLPKSEPALTIVDGEGMPVSDARDLLQEQGTFGATLTSTEGSDLLEMSDNWPVYKFESDEAFIAATKADPPTHDLHVLYRMMQDRIAYEILEPMRWLPRAKQIQRPEWIEWDAGYKVWAEAAIALQNRVEPIVSGAGAVAAMTSIQKWKADALLAVPQEYPNFHDVGIADKPYAEWAAYDHLLRDRYVELDQDQRVRVTPLGRELVDRINDGAITLTDDPLWRERVRLDSFMYDSDEDEDEDEAEGTAE